MRYRLQFALLLGTLAACSQTAFAQTDLQKNLKDTGVGAHWIYNDIAKGFAEARETGKPLLVSFRCVP